MLNDTLYTALIDIFKSVEVSNEGIAADIIPTPGLLTMWKVPGSGEGGSRGEQYRVNCPFCGDKRKRLYISYLSYARPVVNGVELPAGPLMAYCQNERCMDKRENRDVLAGMLGRAMNGIGACQVSISGDEAVDCKERPCISNELSLDGIKTWVPDYRPVTEDSDPVILSYLKSRRITMDDISWLRIGYGPIRTKSKGLLKNGVSWIIFPIIQNDRLVGVQARCPDAFMDPGDKMKYYFHPACRKAAALYNIDIARRIGLGVVCEGVFDVASIGRPGVCCFGHTPSAIQSSMLASIGTCLIWLPDTDKNAECDPVDIANTFVDRWNSAGVFAKGAHVVILPKKDAGDMTRIQVWQTILQQVPDSVGDYLMTRVIDKL